MLGVDPAQFAGSRRACASNEGCRDLSRIDGIENRKAPAVVICRLSFEASHVQTNTRDQKPCYIKSYNCIIWRYAWKNKRASIAARSVVANRNRSTLYLTPDGFTPHGVFGRYQLRTPFAGICNLPSSSSLTDGLRSWTRGLPYAEKSQSSLERRTGHVYCII